MKLIHGTTLVVTKDTVAIRGRAPSGNFGVWILKRKVRIFAIDNIIRYYTFSTDQLMKKIKEI